MDAFAHIETAPVAPAPIPGSSQDEAMRARLFDQFNAFWLKAAGEGVPYDTIGTMAVTAAVYGLMAKHGPKTLAEFLDGLANDVRTGTFHIPGRRS